MMFAFVAVRLVKKPVTAVKRFAKKLVDVALVVDAFVAKRLVEVLLVVDELVAKKLVVVLFVEFRFEIVPEADVRSVIVALVIVVVASVEVPRTIERPEVVALPFASTAKFELAVQALPFQ